MNASTRTVVAVFDDHSRAERAVADLVSSGFSRDSIDITSSSNFGADSALGNTGLTGQQPRDASSAGIGGFFRRMFGADDDYAAHYDEAVRRGSYVVSVTTDDEDRASDILDRNGAIDVEERAASWTQDHSGTTPNPTGTHLVRGDNAIGEQSIPVVREELHVGKREVRRGGVRVFNRITEQPVQEQVQLREEHVRVERRPVDRPATEMDFRAQDDVIEVVEMAEEAVIGKTARVVEEVVVGKETTQRTETVHDTLRRTDVNVENIGSQTGGSANYDDDFRQDFHTRYGSVTGAQYDTYAPSYQYGSRMASDQHYQGRSWADVESTLRSDYERSYPGKWEQMKDSVRYGWEKVTSRR